MLDYRTSTNYLLTCDIEISLGFRRLPVGSVGRPASEPSSVSTPNVVDGHTAVRVNGGPARQSRAIQLVAVRRRHQLYVDVVQIPLISDVVRVSLSTTVEQH